MVLETILERITATVFGFLCHQDPGILMTVAGKEILLCPRCMGLHLGFSSSFILMALTTSSRVRIIGRATQLVFAMAIGSMAIDWGLGGCLGLYAPTHLSRLATGLATGSALSVLVISYRRGMVMPLDAATLNLTGPQMASLVCFSSSFCYLVVVLNHWAFLSSVLLLCVIANASIAVHTVVLIMRSRLVRRAAVDSLLTNKGGIQ